MNHCHHWSLSATAAPVTTITVIVSLLSLILSVVNGGDGSDSGDNSSRLSANESLDNCSKLVKHVTNCALIRWKLVPDSPNNDDQMSPKKCCALAELYCAINGQLTDNCPEAVPSADVKDENFRNLMTKCSKIKFPPNQSNCGRLKPNQPDGKLCNDYYPCSNVGHMSGLVFIGGGGVRPLFDYQLMAATSAIICTIGFRSGLDLV
ncbi:uncharacterized protein LOC128962841 [Oppia nitens]|uniref:uncharacterized protein LOC128962841 n=1 Tax=Oppia nitens TaxID=1686743 RepID=UPI0023DA9F02|nr:uncharacterized protein LOC128962841 [Oppia nitens]